MTECKITKIKDRNTWLPHKSTLRADLHKLENVINGCHIKVY